MGNRVSNFGQYARSEGIYLVCKDKFGTMVLGWLEENENGDGVNNTDYRICFPQYGIDFDGDNIENVFGSEDYADTPLTYCWESWEEVDRDYPSEDIVSTLVGDRVVTPIHIEADMFGKTMEEVGAGYYLILA